MERNPGPVGQAETAPGGGQLDYLQGARWQPSPNCDRRPAGTAIDMIVIHGISLPPGHFGGPHIEALFCNRLDAAGHPYFADIAHLKVSAHLLVRRDGSVIQFVPFGMRAWHAGASVFCGRPRCNDFSIGIELEGSDHTAYDRRQYRALNPMLAELMGRWPTITPRRIVGHCHISPGRKTDPGPAFDWAKVTPCVVGREA